jgi:glutamine synthetase, type III
MINISGKQLIPAARAAAYHIQIVADMRVLRESADALETVVDKDLWPLPSYGDLLFEVSEP